MLLVNFVIVFLSASGISTFKCLPGNLAVYNLKLKTYWEEGRFPKQYPQWRPPAQWSKTIGFVHRDGPELFSIGSSVSPGVRSFAETGSSDILEQEIGSRSDSILDTILLPQILQGVGEVQATLFVDSNHTKVSFLTKIVPSPDWFVGLDSLDLCRDGEFIDSIAIKVDPMDAGTDNGFTFTSPNWPTEPQGVVFRITHDYPTHPAGSFNYPHLDKLPTLALFTINKERDYELSAGHKDSIKGFISDQRQDKFNNGHNSGHDSPNIGHNSHNSVHDSQANEVSVKDSKGKYEYSLPNQASGGTKSSLDEIIDFVPYEETTRIDRSLDVQTNEIVPEKTMKTTLPLHKQNKGFRATGYLSSSAPEDFLKKKYKSEYLSKSEDVVYHTQLDSHKKEDMLASILNSYKNKKVGLTKRRRIRRKRRNHKKPRNCSVSDWIEWSSCSKSCGIGEAVRTRTILKHPRHGGTPCPKLRDYKWCGSARNCNSGYFHW